MIGRIDNKLAKRARRVVRRGFSLVELLIALAITAALMVATMTALDASFTAYQTTTETASTHAIGRLTVDRIQAMIRTGQGFGPLPLVPSPTTLKSDYIDIVTPAGQQITIEWQSSAEALYVIVDGDEHLLMEGVIAQTDPDTGETVAPFTLEFASGRQLYRATIDFLIVPDDNMSVVLDGDSEQTLHLIASSMPRSLAY